MNKYLLPFITALLFSGCTTYMSSYDFVVESRLTEDIVTIVPSDKSDFWLTGAEEFILLPGERLIIGTASKSSHDKGASDYIKDDGYIAFFKAYRSGIQLPEELCLRAQWVYSVDKKHSHGIYTLTFK